MITPSEEEQLLIDQLIGCRQSLARAEMEYIEVKALKNRMEKQLEDVEQAILDHLNANGLVQFQQGHHSITLGTRESIDIGDPEAVPDEFTRIKREPDKTKIKNTKPQGNWWTLTTKQHITLRTKESEQHDNII